MKNQFFRPVLLLTALLLAPAIAAPPKITPAKDLIGFTIGDDYHMANYTQITTLWKKWEKELNAQSRARIKMNLVDFFKDDPIEHPLFKDAKERLQLIQNLFTRTEKSVC